MEQTMELEIVNSGKTSFFKGFLTVLLTTVLLFGGAAYAAGYILFNGPSPAAGYQVLQLVEEYPAAQFVRKLYLSDEQLQALKVADEGAVQYSVFPVGE